MSDRTFDHLLDAWLELGPTAAPERVAAAARLEARGIRQATGAPGRWLPQRWMDMHRTVPVAVAAAVIIAAFLGFSYLLRPDVGTPQPGAPTPVPSASVSPVAVPSLPALNLPATRADAAGVYGWTFRPGRGLTGMHWVIEGAAPREAAAIMFDQGPDCLGTEGQGATPVRIGGLEGVVVEPYLPVVSFGPRDGDEVTRAYALAVEDRTLCVFVTWNRTTTTDAERQTALEVVETIEAVPFEEEGIRFIFTLPAGWDTG
jgi:hypothetical protein